MPAVDDTNRAPKLYFQIFWWLSTIDIQVNKVDKGFENILRGRSITN